MKTFIYSLILMCSFSQVLHAQFVANLETINLGSDSHIDGSAGDSLIREEGFQFPILWDDAWNFWAGGWAVSNKSDSSRRGTEGLFQAITAGGYNSSNYLIGQQGSMIPIESSAKTPLTGLYITNTSYAYHSMNEGDPFAKKFGGIDGNDPDFFVLHILAKENGNWKPDTVHVYLADFRASDPSEDYILNSWLAVDISQLGTADTLLFLMESSDNGDFGMNTPGFFAIDALSRNWHVSVQNMEKTATHLYPNPALNHLYLSEPTDWTIFDSQGKQVLMGNGDFIDIGTLHSGVYHLRNAQGHSTQFIKK